MKQHTPSWISGLNGLDLIARAHQLVQEGYKCASASSLTHFLCQQKQAILCDEAALTWWPWWHMAHPNRYMFADPMNPDDKTGLLVTVWLWPKVSIEGLMSSWILQFSLRSAPNYCYRCGNVGPQTVETMFLGHQPFTIDRLKHQVASILDVDELGKREWPNQRCWWFHQLVHRFRGYSLAVGEFFPHVQVPHLPGSAGISCCGAGVWGGVLWKWDGLAVDLCVGYRQGPEVFGEDLWVVAQVPPRQLVPYFLWCLYQLRWGKNG